MAAFRNGQDIPTRKLFRMVALDRDAISARAEGDDRIPVAFASEEPCARWFGIEILDHGDKSVDLSYAKDGLPLLLDHNPTRQIGIIEDVQVGSDKRLRGMARFSRSAQAQEVKQDVEDGIRRNMSVGYQLTGVLEEIAPEEKGGEWTYRCAWRPMEGSLVAIPADITVGVGRAWEPVPEPGAAPVPAAQITAPTLTQERSMPDTPAAPVTGGQPAAPAAPAAPAPDFRAEAQRLGELARGFNALDLLPAWLERGISVNDAMAELRTRRGIDVRPINGGHPELDISPKERRAFSIGRALVALATRDFRDAGYEREVSSALAKVIGQDPAGLFIPTRGVPIAGSEMLQRTSHSAGGSTTGSKLVYTEPGPFIDLLRNRSVVMRLGSLILSGLRGNLALPRQATAGSAAYYAELAGGTDFSESNMTFDQVTFSPKSIASTQSYSKQLLAQAIEAIDALVAMDILTVIALKFDNGALHGNGMSNALTGIYSISGVNTVAFGGNGISYDGAVDMETAIEADNALLESIAYVTTPEVKGAAKKTQLFAGTNGAPLWTGGIDGEMNSYRAMASNQVAKNLSPGTAHGLILGAWSQAVVADWGAIDMTVDPYTKARQGVINVTGLYLADFNVRHPESFAIATGLAALPGT